MKTDNRSNRVLDALWDIFASVKLTVVILTLLAATSVIGTFIPQKADPSFYVRAYGEFAYRLMQVFDILDMYYSWWFQTLIGILAVTGLVLLIGEYALDRQPIRRGRRASRSHRSSPEQATRQPPHRERCAPRRICERFYQNTRFPWDRIAPLK